MFGLHRTTTAFPGSIDARSYYSNVSIPHKNTMKSYNELILQQKYKEASQYLYNNIESKNVDLDYNGAYVWNRTDNQMVALENYAVNVMEETEVRPYYSNNRPGTKKVGMSWISS